MFCRKCGKTIEESSKFCTSCGAPVDKVDSGTSGPELIKQGTEVTINEVREHIEGGKESGKLYLFIGWVSVVVSLVLIPILFGAIAIIMGYLYRYTEEKMGTILMISGGAGGLLGMIIGISAGY